jgi:hypothetical protein
MNGAWLSEFLKKLEREKLGLGLLQLLFERGVLGPERRRVVYLLEDDVVTLDQVERHRLGLEGLDDLGRGQLDDGINILPARGRLRDDLD